MRVSAITVGVGFIVGSAICIADEPIFSGPQIGEAVVPFEAHCVFGENAGQAVKVLEDKGAPTLLVFVHQVTRPSIGVTRLIMNFANTKKKDGLKSHLVFLSDDRTETEAWFRRARRALPGGAEPLISMDGLDGPGAYGLNRKMTLTVLVSDQGKVIANFPLVQPSMQADAPKIGHAIVKALGGEKKPTLKEMGFDDRRMNMRRGAANPAQDGTYRRMMAPVIQKTATPDEVAIAAKRVEEMAAKTPWFKERVHNASRKIVGSGKLSNYGIAEAQEYLKKWAVEFAPTEEKDKTSNADTADKTETASREKDNESTAKESEK